MNDTTNKLRYLQKQIKDQSEMIQALKDSLKLSDRIVKSYESQLKNFGYYSAKEVLRPKCRAMQIDPVYTKMGLN